MTFFAYEELLYHSPPMHPFWNSILQPAFRALDAKRIVEIGVGSGDTTKKILEYCRETGGMAHIIDPSPLADISALLEEYSDHAMYYPEPSLSALPKISDADVVLIDGDHNWYTVHAELEIIAKTAVSTGSFPVIFLHDIGWPYARRDMYYDPENIPGYFRQAHERGGVLPTQSSLSPTNGFNTHFEHAIYEGNPHNGVLTAIEDFLEETDRHLSFLAIPGQHGLGIICPQEILKENEAFSHFFRSLDLHGPILEHVKSVEGDRIDALIQAQNLSSAYRQKEQEVEEMKATMTDLQDKWTGQLHMMASERRDEQMSFDAAHNRMEADIKQRMTEAQTLLAEQDAMIERIRRMEREKEITAEEMQELFHEQDIAIERMLQTERERSVELEELHMFLRNSSDEHRSVISEKDATIQNLQNTLREKETLAKEIYTIIADRDEEIRRQSERADGLAAELSIACDDKRKALMALEFRTAEMAHLQQTRSWLWTKPLRRLEERLREWLQIYKEKTEARHAIVPPSISTNLVPSATNASAVTQHDLVQRDADPAWIAPFPPTVAVIIPCHNYGRFLAEAIESVLAQTLLPQEIVVVDDASTDNTRAVADSFAGKGVRYIRGEWHAVGEARNAGLRATTSDLLVFLDADDLIHPQYLRTGLTALMADRTASIAYTDQQYFGRKKLLYHAPPAFDWHRFDLMCHFNVAAMVRRDALVQAGGWSHGKNQDGDWITWRRILALGWKAVKSDGLWFYRIHENNMHTTLNAKYSYAHRSGFTEEPTTLCLSLSGRTWAWPLTRAFLETQTWPHDRMHLILLDTSQNDTFGEEIRQWLGKCDYASHTYLQQSVGMQGLADLPREEYAAAVDQACAGIYNRFARLARTPIVCFLEDDVIPPPDVYERLIASMTRESVSVSAVYFKRDHSHTPVTWDWSSTGHPVDGTTKTGITQVGGNGFGCVVVRGDFIRRTVFRRGPLSYCYDHNFYKDMREQNMQALVDWDCVCKHYQNATTWS